MGRKGKYLLEWTLGEKVCWGQKLTSVVHFVDKKMNRRPSLSRVCYSMVLMGKFLSLMGAFWVIQDTWDDLLGSWFLPNLNIRRRLAWNTIQVVVLWTIWKERNARVFEGKSTAVNELFQKAKGRLCLASF